MPYLRAKSASAAGAAGATTQYLADQSVEYETLVALRDPTNTALTLWEEIAEEDVNNAVGAVRVAIIANPDGAAIAANATSSQREAVGRPGTITQVNYVANSPGIVGAATNSRTLTVVQGTAPGAGSPARTTLATLALIGGVNAPTGQLSSAFTINSAAFISDVPLELVSTAVGTGIVDPGGLVVVTFTA